MIRRVALLAALWSLVAVVGLSTGACTSLGSVADRPTLANPQVLALLDDPALTGTRWGLMVVTAEGEPVVERRADDRFIPASNAKIFTTAAAFALIEGLEAADADDGTSVRLEARPDGGAPDIALVGSGDPALGDGPGCVSDCLAELADQTAARVTRVGDVIGDDRLYPDERWGPGWSWEDMQAGFGTAVSALTVNDNVVVLEVAPGDGAGAPVRAQWRPGDDLQPLENTAITIEAGDADLRLERRPGEEAVRLYGRMPMNAPATALRVGLDDPALTAARRFRRLLEARGVTVEGQARARHRPLALADDRGGDDGAVPAVEPDGVEIARLTRPPLLASLIRTGKLSQNLHAELILRRLGGLEGTGSRADGLFQVKAVLAGAGLERSVFDLYDASGLSAYNRVSPRATTRFLQWTMSQPWGEAWRATLAVGGRDGTLSRRFVGTPLEGRIFAKTGSLNGVNALAGFLTAASGRTLVFSIYANDRPSTAGSSIAVMDRVLLALAAEN
ncbi:MAG: D-alanyl-D-alanine carboxypeptidase/D-alanyl-D-alanine-endopeptidase [Brevundimonas sp.]|uniref:D-alanyl-D-alanine carboxypeptidase/D-alanyl-D-alanine endopeptidase n=1 Tax=Brevundimonas sp. TaxID=1871086 RepID=UPI0027351E23|nr:D-alanyl-D-alanine carboxypeptidase/D-alanyl-D-alanine-endopeptidase [Brevundimonas sp.]MDP3406114.1 D-alanyl-D-alanine carboxypeptidase/D-alanyl-D-alanine-endopeptidase [Brevundimonas sp.]